jgi:uncharacterized protein YqeY
LGLLPAQATEADIIAAVHALIAVNGWTAKEFGLAMKALKDQFGATADGAVLSKVLKETLK